MFFFYKAHVCKIADMDPSLHSVNLKAAINVLEQGKIDRASENKGKGR
jgi:hypothetical protein